MVVKDFSETVVCTNIKPADRSAGFMFAVLQP